MESGKQLEDQVLKFRQELWLYLRNLKQLKADEKSSSAPVEGVGHVPDEENVEGVGMPDDWYPLYWLPFVLYGNFSDSPVHLVDMSKAVEDNPLKDKVDSRVQVRSLAQQSKESYIEENSKKKKKYENRISWDLVESSIIKSLAEGEERERAYNNIERQRDRFIAQQNNERIQWEKDRDRFHDLWERKRQRQKRFFVN